MRPRFVPAVRRRSRIRAALVLAGLAGAGLGTAPRAAHADDTIPAFAELLSRRVRLKPELVSLHPRVFVTARGLETLRERARTTHRDDWQRVLATLPAMAQDPPPPPGPQARRSQNNVAHAIAGVSLAWAVEQRPELLAAAKKWTLAASRYEPWGYSYNKPNVDLAAGHLLYAIGWAYDLLYHELTTRERATIRAALERHAALVDAYFRPGGPRSRFEFTQNHNFIPTAGLGVAALALLGESEEAERWAATAYAHHHRANQLLSPDGYYYEGIEYWIFSAPWLVHFADAWLHATGESLFELGPYRNWTSYVAHVIAPNGQDAFDFGDAWEGSLTRERRGAEISRLYPGGKLQSNANLLFGVAARLRDPATQAVAERCRAFGHSSLEEYWTLLWRDPTLEPAPISAVPTAHHFEDSGVFFYRTSWEQDALAFAFKAGPPEGHRAARLLAGVPEWRPSTGHSHPDAGSFIVWSGDRHVVGDTGYAGRPQSRHHNTVVVGGLGQGTEREHDAWEGMDRAALGAVRILGAESGTGHFRLAAEIAAAYPPQAALLRFRRELSYTAPGRFELRDRLEASRAQAFAWLLHADSPFTTRGAGFENDVGGVRLAGEIRGPQGVRVRAGPTILTAPGPPGSIESGSQDQRGFELVVELSDPAQTVELEMRFEVARPKP